MAANLKFGLPLLGAGFFTGLLGFIFLLDRWLLTLSNVLNLLGFCVILGPRKFYRFFANPSRFRGTCAYLFGIAAILFGWPLLGLIVQAYGLYQLFGAFLPSVISYIKVTPIGPILQWPLVKQVVQHIQEEHKLPM